MITAAEATAISDAVLAGGESDGSRVLESSGNELLDELNMAVNFAAMKGEKTAYLNISKYPRITVQNCVDTLTGLGYDVDQSRVRSYKELFLNWA